MRYETVITIDQQKAKEYQDLLDGTAYDPESSKDDVIETFSGRFDNGFEVDIKIVNGDTESDVYIDAVLFDENNNEVGFENPADILLGGYEFIFGEDIYYIVVKEG